MTSKTPASVPATTMTEAPPYTRSRLEQGQSPLFRLPLEIRLMIYSHLVQPTYSANQTPDDKHRFVAQKHAPDPYPSPSPHPQQAPPPPTLHIRTLEPRLFCTLAPRLPNRYIVRDFRGMSSWTSFGLCPAPHLSPAVLGTCQRVHAEASRVLYADAVFDFSLCTEAVAPFFSALAPSTRALVRAVRVVKRPQCYDKEFDRAEWCGAMEALAGMRLERLELVVTTGQPAANLSGPIREDEGRSRPFADTEWPLLVGMEGFEWVRDLTRIKGLKEIRIDQHVEHCPPSVSAGMEKWIRFSESVRGSFRRYLERKMTLRDQSVSSDIIPTSILDLPQGVAPAAVPA